LIAVFILVYDNIKKILCLVVDDVVFVSLNIILFFLFSGWDIETGDENGLKPDFLISLAAPKSCTKLFKGKRHYLGGRFIPKTLEQKYELHLPVYPGSNCIIELKVDNDKTETKENSDNKCEQ
jgi:hypothetical protein